MQTTNITIYCLTALLIVIGILFIVRWRFYAKGYKDKYTITVTATVVEPESIAFFIPLMVYEADIDGMPETLYELPSIGAPSLQLPPGYKVKLYIHPDPKKQKTVMFTEKPRPFVNELSAPFNSLFFKLMGIGFLLAAVVLFKLSTMM